MDIKSLKPTSAKLLLHLLLENTSAEHLSGLAGALDMDRKTLMAARNQLKEAGIVGENFRITSPAAGWLLGKISPMALPTVENFPTMMGIIPQGEEKFPTTEEVFPTEEELPSDNPRTRCSQADRSGERTKQVEALHFSFGKRFPDKPQPNDESMRILLRLTGDSAEDVDEAFETAAVRPIESPWSYVRAMLARQKAAPKFAPVAIGPTSRSLDPDDLPPVDTETLAKMRAAGARMRQLGILPADGGDKWQ
jgi:hypothetical protein